MKVWIVEGHRGVVGVFATQEAAEKAKEDENYREWMEGGWKSARVKEYEVQ